MMQRYKDMVQQHGMFAMAYYTSMYVCTGAGVYGLLQSGLVNSDGAVRAVQAIAQAVGLGDHVDLSRADPRLGNLAVAVAVNELLEVVRLPFVLATIPAAHRLFDAVKPWKSDPNASAAASKLPHFGVFYGVLWGAGFAASYAALLAVGADPVLAALDSALHRMGLPAHATAGYLDSTAGHAVIALALNEVLEVVRLPVALAAFPAVHRAWTQRRA